MSELRTHSLRHNSATGDANIEMYADGSTSIRNLQNFAKSLVINGAMAVAQRGVEETDVLAAGYHTVDRMRYSVTQLATLRTTVSQSTEAPAGFGHSWKVEVTTTQAAGDDSGLRLQYRVEGRDMQHLDWGTANAKSLSVSFWVRSSVAGDYSLTLYRDEATDRNIGTTFTITADEASNNTWKLITHTFPGDQTTAVTDDEACRLELTISMTAGTDFRATNNTSWDNYATGRYAFGHTANFTASVNSTFYVTGLQITPTDAPIEFQHETYGETLAKCQRYYTFMRSGIPATSTFTLFAIGRGNTGTNARFAVPHPVTMRATPALSSSGAFTCAGGAVTSMSTTHSSPWVSQLSVNRASGMTASDAVELRANDDTDARLIFNAEL